MNRNKDDLITKTKRYIIENNMVKNGDTVICALSGGADSVCMTYIMTILAKEMDFFIAGAHLNHCLRGEAANEDENFSRVFCESCGIPFYSERIDVKLLAQGRKTGEEEAGRLARYTFFRELKLKINADKIATAHNKNDNAETVMHHIIRGSGVSGITGIAPVRDDIIRPMLCVTRKEIEEFCEKYELKYVTDSTNFKKIYTRNRIRLELFPYIRKIFNADIIDKLTVLSETAYADNDYINKEVDKFEKKYVIYEKNRVSVEIGKLVNLHVSLRNRLLKLMAEKAGGMIEYKHTALINKFIETAETGKKLNIPGISVRKSYNTLIFEKETSDESYEIKVYDNMNITVNGYIIQCGRGGIKIPEGTIVRNRRAGDKITVNGMTKKVKKIFIDKKIPADLRNKIPIAEYKGELLLIGGIIKADALNKYNESKLELNIIAPKRQ